MKLALSIPGMTGTPIDSGLPVPTGGLFTTGHNILIAFITLVVVIGILVSLFLIGRGGINIITSRGDKEKVNKGRERIMYAFMGLLAILISFVIISIFSAFLGSNLIPFLFK